MSRDVERGAMLGIAFAAGLSQELARDLTSAQVAALLDEFSKNRVLVEFTVRESLAAPPTPERYERVICAVAEKLREMLRARRS